jgi:hypothetical protein
MLKSALAGSTLSRRSVLTGAAMAALGLIARSSRAAVKPTITVYKAPG